MKTDVSLTKKDWEEGKAGAIHLLKNAMVQVIIYQTQLEVCEREIARIEAEEASKKAAEAELEKTGR